jgi:hypothetical protein
MNAALGGRMIFKSDETVRTPDRPLAHIETVRDVETMDDIDWGENPVMQDYFRQIYKYQSLHADAQVVSLQGVSRLDNTGSRAIVVMHTPYTTAFRLFGEGILEKMMLEEDVAQAIFSWLMRQYKSLWRLVCSRYGWTPAKVHFGDCAATMLSPGLYGRLLLPMYKSLMDGYEECTVHSCGPSSHLLDLFAQVPKVTQLQLGDGTDLKRVREYFPESSVIAYFSPVRLTSEGPDEIEKDIFCMAEKLEDNFVVRCGSADPNTSAENVQRFLDVSLKMGN